MNRRIFGSLVLATVLLVVAVVLLGSGRLYQAAEGTQGCLSCHETLSTLVPEQHPKVTLGEVGSCLVCHGLEGTAAAFEWVIHRDHFAAEAFKGDCLSCHIIEEGKFKLSGVASAGVETTQEDVNRVSPYYRSWASSELADHTHAQAGVICSTCHGTPFPKPAAEVLMDQCGVCHGSYYDVLPELTLEIKPNPHEVTHVGLLECTQCHGAHKESQNYCSSCH